MATLADLEAAIEAVLDDPLGVRRYQLVRRTAEKAYEAYVFCLCLRAVRELGGQPALRGNASPPSPSSPFVFRGAPGQIYSNARNYGYVEFALGEETFEIHTGVEFAGTSGVTHELDVSIVRADEAAWCRALSEPPRAASLIAAWECKFYSETLGKALGRAFVGLLDDMGNRKRLAGLCSNATSPQLKRYFQARRRPTAHFDLSPAEASNEDIFVNTLKGELRKLAAS